MLDRLFCVGGLGLTDAACQLGPISPLRQARVKLSPWSASRLAQSLSPDGRGTGGFDRPSLVLGQNPNLTPPWLPSLVGQYVAKFLSKCCPVFGRLPLGGTYQTNREILIDVYKESLSLCKQLFLNHPAVSGY